MSSAKDSGKARRITLAVGCATCFSTVTLSRDGVADLTQHMDGSRGTRMTNATGSRHYEEEVMREAASVARGSGVGALAGEHNEALVAGVVAELDRICEQIFGSGCTLSLTDSNGVVLYERSD